MGVEDNNENQLIAAYMLVKKCEETIEIIKEWLACCENEELVSYKHFHSEIDEFDDFYSHREDQSILTNIAIKRNLPIFRDPSDYGEFPHMYYSVNYSYVPKGYPNSNYPTIILSNRRFYPPKYVTRYLLKKILNIFGLINPDKIIADKNKKGL